MSSLSRELVFIILQFLGKDEKFKETVHKLEQESGFFFNMKYFEDQVQAGEWDEVDRYLCGFTKVEDNRFSMKLFFEIRKQKYLEALDKNDRAKAVEILTKDLMVFSTFNEELYMELTQLLALDNFRGNEQLSEYGDTKSARTTMLVELKKLIQANPLFRDKLVLPTFNASQLQTLINQSLNWQHQLGENPCPDPDIKTVFTDHTCAPGNGGCAPPLTNAPLTGPVPRAGVFQLGDQVELKPVAGCMPSTSQSIPHAAFAAAPPSLGPSPGAGQVYKLNNTTKTSWGKDAFVKHLRELPGATGSAYRKAVSEYLMKRKRTTSLSDIATDMKRITLDIVDKGRTWKFPDIVNSVHLKSFRLPDPLTASKVMQLIYTNSGLELLALDSNAAHKIWKWQRNERNPSGKSSASIVPQFWQLKNGALMSNDSSETKSVKESAACIALSKNNRLMSASGGKISVFNMMTFKIVTTFMPPPPAATFLAFHPQDHNIIAVGMEDSTIQIYNVSLDKVKIKLKGHQKQITGLAFSQKLQVLVSSAADAQLCIWNIDGWEKRNARPIQALPGHSSSLVGETKVQFHNDQLHLLVVHESQIGIYNGKLECLIWWSPRDSLSAAISSAIYSCDGLLLITGFCDGAVGIFEANSLRLRCRIAPSAYKSILLLGGDSSAYPVAIAAHPSDPHQFALGMSNGSVYVIEPSEIPTR